MSKHKTQPLPEYVGFKDCPECKGAGVVNKSYGLYPVQCEYCKCRAAFPNLDSSQLEYYVPVRVNQILKRVDRSADPQEYQFTPEAVEYRQLMRIWWNR